MLSSSSAGFVFLLAWSVPQLDAPRPEWAILHRASELLQDAEGVPLEVGGVVNVPPLMPEQLGIGSALWTEPPEPGTRLPGIRLSVTMFEISTAEAAARFFEDRETLERYDLGDQAAMSVNEAQDSSSLYVRKGRFLAFVSGAPDDTKLVARYLVEAMAEVD